MAEVTAVVKVQSPTWELRPHIKLLHATKKEKKKKGKKGRKKEKGKRGRERERKEGKEKKCNSKCLRVFCFLFFVFFFSTRGIWKFPGQGLNPSHSCKLCPSCGSTRSFNPLHQAGGGTLASAAT